MHVPRALIKILRSVEDNKTLASVTNVTASTRFHACRCRPCGRGTIIPYLPCCPQLGSNFIRIRLAGFWFARADLADDVRSEMARGYYVRAWMEMWRWWMGLSFWW